MKFVVNTSELQKALSKVNGVIPSKSTSPILETILFDVVNNTLTLTGTDTELTLSVELNVKGEEDGRVAIPAKRLIDTIRSLPDQDVVFSIDITNEKIKITSRNGEYSLVGESAKDFPASPQFKGTDELAMESGVLKKIISRTTFAVSMDDLRPAMMGVLFQVKGSDIRAVATDGHRLVRYVQKLSKASTLKRDIIVPAKALLVAGKILEDGKNAIAVSETHIRFSFDHTVLISRLIDETYPNYESVIPQDNANIMTIGRDELVSSLRRVSLYSSASTHQVRFQVGKSGLKVSAQDIDFGGEAKETIACEYSADALDIGFNATYVLDVLTHLDDQKVEFKFSSPTRAGIVTPSAADGKKAEDVIMLVMPVRLNI